MTHNIYFDGQVQSLGFNSEDGRATVGVITPGRYAFSTESEERVVIIAGQLRVKLPGEEWVRITLWPETLLLKWRPIVIPHTFAITRR